MTSSLLGYVYLPKNERSNVGVFQFRLDGDLGDRLQIGSMVTADTAEGPVVGVVTDMDITGRHPDPIVARQFGAGEDSVQREEDLAHIAHVKVYKAERLRPVGAGAVRPSTPEEVAATCGAEDMKVSLPGGVIELVDGTFAAVPLDAHALLGPESAHMTVGGMSGVAAKTSYTTFLAKAALELVPQQGESVAAVLFNVKGADLLALDEPVSDDKPLEEDDYKIYEALGVKPGPFENVTYWAPGLPLGGGVNSLREDANPLRWSLEDVWDYMSMFFAQDWSDEKVQSFFSDFEDRHLSGPSADRIATFDRLDTWFAAKVEEFYASEESDGSMAWGTHHIRTFERIRRMLTNLPARGKGLMAKGPVADTDDLPVSGWKSGDIHVIDIAALTPEVQAVAVARITKRLMKAAERNELGVDHVILAFDEANQFIPASGGAAYGPIKKELKLVASQGRYVGISLWGAAQFVSKVEPEITGNCATKAVGRTTPDELQSGTYGRLAPGVQEQLLTLPRGSMALWHYTFRDVLVVRFPRPAWRTGKPSAAAPAASSVLGKTAKEVEILTEGLDTKDVERILAGSSTVAEAQTQLERERTPDMDRIKVNPGGSRFDPDDPLGFG